MREIRRHFNPILQVLNLLAGKVDAPNFECLLRPKTRRQKGSQNPGLEAPDRPKRLL